MMGLVSLMGVSPGEILRMDALVGMSLVAAANRRENRIRRSQQPKSERTMRITTMDGLRNFLAGQPKLKTRG